MEWFRDFVGRAAEAGQLIPLRRPATDEERLAAWKCKRLEGEMWPGVRAVLYYREPTDSRPWKGYLAEGEEWLTASFSDDPWEVLQHLHEALAWIAPDQWWAERGLRRPRAGRLPTEREALAMSFRLWPAEADRPRVTGKWLGAASEDDLLALYARLQSRRDWDRRTRVLEEWIRRTSRGPGSP